MNIKRKINYAKAFVQIELYARGTPDRRVCWPVFYLGLSVRRRWGSVRRWLRSRFLPSDMLSVSELAGVNEIGDC